jgi:hypothetical protein
MLIPEPIAATARCYESADIDVRNAFREQMRPLVATLTTERDALRAALEGMTRVMHEVLRQHGWQAAEDTIKVAERALAGTGETP